MADNIFGDMCIIVAIRHFFWYNIHVVHLVCELSQSKVIIKNYKFHWFLLVSYRLFQRQNCLLEVKTRNSKTQIQKHQGPPKIGSKFIKNAKFHPQGAFSWLSGIIQIVLGPKLSTRSEDQKFKNPKSKKLMTPPQVQIPPLVGSTKPQE